MAEMEHTIETTGENIEAAIAEGLITLEVDRDAVEVEVLDEGSRGVLGLGTREARVRLTVKPSPALTPSAEPVTPSAAEPPVPAPVEERDEAEVAQGVLLDLLALVGIEEAQVEVRQAAPAPGEEVAPLILDVRGPGTDALIGRRGETLAALQHITRLIVGREMTGRTRLVVDVAGYKARRENTLYRLAQHMAEQATRTNRTVALEPMPPHERRIIHLALRDHSHVTTQSVGEGDRRKVTIIPR